MTKSFTVRKRIRKTFGRIGDIAPMPNLIEVQKDSYNEFLTSKFKKDQLSELNKGINKVFQSVFPIEDGSEKATLEFISYSFDKPKFDVLECKQRSLT